MDNLSSRELSVFIHEAFRRFQWSKHEQVPGVNYKSDCCSALHALPPSDVGKYSRVYYFTSLEHAISNLRDKRIKLSSFDSVNDVFEIYSFIESNPSRRTSLSDQAREVARREAEKRLFLSTTLDWNIPGMWYHYADKHNGVCLGLDVRTDLLSPVSYIDNRGLVDEDILGAAGDSLFKIKHSSWSYENEYRLILNKDSDLIVTDDNMNALRFIKSSSDSFLFKEIVFGLNVCDGCISREMAGIDKSLNLTILKARKSDHEYKMVPSRIDEYGVEPYYFENEQQKGIFRECLRIADIL